MILITAGIFVSYHCKTGIRTEIPVMMIALPGK